MLVNEPEVDAKENLEASKDYENHEATEVLILSGHHLNTVHVGHIVPSSFGDASEEQQPVSDVEVSVKQQCYHNNDVQDKTNEEHRPPSHDVRSSRQDE